MKIEMGLAAAVFAATAAQGEIQGVATGKRFLREGRDGNGDPIFFRNRYGKGTVYLIGFPLEKRLYARQGAFASDAWKIYSAVVKRPQLIDDGARDVLESEHFFSDRRAAVILVNNSSKPHEGEVRVADGWRVTRTLSDRPDLAALEKGKLRLGVNAGLLVLMER